MDDGYRFSSQIVTGLRLFNASVAVVIVGLKLAADMHKHGTHEAHHQLCDCLGVCYVCVWENAKESARQKVGQ